MLEDLLCDACHTRLEGCPQCRPESDSPAEPQPSGKLSEDARGLEPTYAGPIAIGQVDAIVGEGGAEVPGFVATTNELLQLVRYWATEILELEWEVFRSGSTGSSEWRTRQFAHRRLNTISKFIGDEEVKKAITEAKQEFGRSVDQGAWKVFIESTEEE